MQALLSFKLIYNSCRCFLVTKSVSKLGENFGKMIKYGTLTETSGYVKRILGETSSSFKDLIFAKFQNFDAD